MLKRIEEIESLAELDDGRLALAFTRHITRLIHDCENRPADEKARTLTINVAIKPTLIEGGYLTDFGVEASIKSKVPDHVTRTINCRVKNGHGGAFNTMSEDNVDQRTIDELAGE